MVILRRVKNEDEGSDFERAVHVTRPNTLSSSFFFFVFGFSFGHFVLVWDRRKGGRY